MSLPLIDPDAAERERAWSSPQSVVVEASAGTGKTTLLIRRVLWLLFERAVPVDRLVGLAFNEKAAAELAGRLRKVLRETVSCQSRDSLPADVLKVAPGMSLASVVRTAGEALAAFEKAHLATIHSFAATILRLYPAEAGVDPQFEIVEEADLEKAIEREWDSFLGSELSNPGEREGAWRSLLRKVRIPDIRELALEAASFRTDIAALRAGRGGAGRDVLGEWAAELQRTAEELLKHTGRSKKTQEALESACPAFAALRNKDPEEFGRRAAGLEVAAGMTRSGWGASAWDPEMREMGMAITRAAKALKGAGGEALVKETLEILYGFARRARQSLIESGKMSYDGLLVLARDLLRDNPDVRRQLKRRFDVLLVDEMQDVDPIQLELILFLVEIPSHAAKRWEQVKIEPGRLFLVGDPKQSIYGFRNADLRACTAVTRMAAGQNAESVRLVTSMRSSREIIEAVNSVGTSLFADSGPVRYLKLEPRSGSAGVGGRPLVLETVPSGQKKAIDSEAAAAAAWTADAVRRGVKPGEIAILFRRKGDMPAYADAFRRLRIPVEIEEERHFYRRTEIADVINLLRLLRDPGDEPALAGFLRGPWGGLDDSGLARWFLDLRRSGARRDFRALAVVSRGAGGERLAAVFETLRELRDSVWNVPGAVWVERVWQAFAVDALAAESSRLGAIMAAKSFKALLGGLIERDGLGGTLEVLRRCLAAEHERRSERPPVSPPATLSGGEARAVRLLTVHQAKGLEFPVVILGGTRSGRERTRAAQTGIRFDWATGLAGAAMHAKGTREAVCTLEGAYLTVLRQDAEEEEEKRLLYVAMTRARERLVIMKVTPAQVPEGRGKGVPGKGQARRGPGRTSAGSFLAMLEPVFASAPGNFEFIKAPAPGKIPASVKPERGPARPASDEEEKIWEVRGGFTAPEVLLTPTDFSERFESGEWDLVPAGSRASSAMLGELCHRVLEKWDFAGDGGEIEGAVEKAIGSLPSAGPVPDAVRRKAVSLLAVFLKSEAAKDLARAEMLGREVPLLCAMEGRVISARADVIFRLDGKLYVGDYKAGERPRVALEVARAYSRSVEKALGCEARFAIISLAKGRMIMAGEGRDDGGT